MQSRIPDNFIQDLLARVDIVDVVGRYVQLKKGGANYLGLCPFHNEKSPSFTVSPAKQFYHCFGCGVHGSAIGFLMEYSGLSFTEAVRDLAQSHGMVVPESEHLLPERVQESKAKSLALAECMKLASDYYKQQLRSSERTIDYLKARGLTGEIAARFGLGYAPPAWDNLRSQFGNYQAQELAEAGLVIDKESEQGQGRRYDRFRDRVMFPIRNTKGQVIAFGGRVIDQGEPKYLNSPETPLFQKGYELYGLFEARQAIREAGYVLVCEGYMDVVALAQMGFPQAVATLGTACTPTHVQKLLKQTDRVVFSFDGDNAGRRAARRALDACLPLVDDGKIIQFLFLPSEHDPDSYIREFGAEAFAGAIAEAMPLSQFLLREIQQECDLQTAEGRARLLHEAKPLLQQMQPTALRLQIVRQLAQMAQAAVGELENLLQLSKPAAPKLQMPARARRNAPMGLERQIMRIVVALPQLAHEIDSYALEDAGSIAPDGAELLRYMVELAQSMGQHVQFAAYAEQLRSQGSDFDDLINEALQQSEQDPELLKQELEGAIRQMRIRVLVLEQENLVQSMAMDEQKKARYREISRLLALLKRGDVAGLQR